MKKSSKWRNFGAKMTIDVKIWTTCEKKLCLNNLIVNLNNFFIKQFDQNIHYRGQFSHLLSMLWTNHQNDVILRPKWPMSKCGQSVKKKVCQKYVIIILNNFFNRKFGQKIQYRGQFSHLLSMLWTNHQNYVMFGAQMTLYVKIWTKYKQINCTKNI